MPEQTKTSTIEDCIFIIRGEKVIFDADLAWLYGVETKRLLEAVKRNKNRFPEDFMFKPTPAEIFAVTTKVRTSTKSPQNQEVENLRSQFATSSSHGGRRYRPYAFTEQGVAMLSSVLNSERAIKVNIEIIRTFVRLKRLIASNSELAKRLDELESKYNGQFRIVFEAIRALMKIDESDKKQQIGFRSS